MCDLACTAWQAIATLGVMCAIATVALLITTATQLIVSRAIVRKRLRDLH